MKRSLILSAFIFIPMMLIGQSDPIRSRESLKSQGSKEKIYSLSGYRHGVNYFPKVMLPQVEYEAGDSLTFDKYHSADVVYTWLKRWAEKYPDLITLYNVGESYEGRPIIQITLTNKKAGKDTDKPAAFFEGGRHSGEVSGTESVLWLTKYLLDNYGIDPDVTHLIDSKTIYLKPINNPDGHNLYLNTAQSNRSSVRPDDSDRDGLIDEDAPEDLDSNGIILTMRWKDEKKGNLISDPDDPSGRIMKRVAPGKGIYLSSSEGIDNDRDSRINEDGIGGLDLHRNYPENWRPRSEETNRGYTQGGSGEYPLSESETKAVVLFLLSHPNIYIVNSMDTSVPMHLRPPSTSASEDRMYPEDLKWYKTFDDIGKKITGYGKAGDVYNDYGNGTPLFGHGPDFGYWYYGAIWYGDEIWNGGKNKDYNGDGTIDQYEVLRWDDEENGGDGFFEWKPFKHEVYGDIEIGGFDPKFFSQNPPAKFMEQWIGNEALFNLEMIKYLPELLWDNIDIKKTKSYKTDSADYQVKISFKNVGKLPTALKQAHLVKIVTNDRVVLDLDTTGTSKENSVFKLISEEKSPKGRDSRGGFSESDRPVQRGPYSVDVQDTQGGGVTTAVFNIRLFKQTEIKGKVSVLSTRGGVLKDKEIIIR
jgi:hypothetical protein